MPELLSTWRDVRLAQCLRRAQEGDRDAFRELYRALHPPVYRFVSRRLARREDAEDVVAQVFWSVLEGLARIDPRRGTLFAYVLATARRAVIDHLRAHARAGAELDAVPLVDPAPSPLERTLASEELAALRAALLDLDAEERELITMRFADGLRFAEIAQMLGLKEPAVRKRVSRTVRELRERLGAPIATKEVLP
jgi:RNA polymerase sigma-70 factor (ECF subfamily)